jgi:hypothetical protein
MSLGKTHVISLILQHSQESKAADEESEDDEERKDQDNNDNGGEKKRFISLLKFLKITPQHSSAHYTSLLKLF